jgi:energy-coupling factor transporter ATP-binding protein EcfA2
MAGGLAVSDSNDYLPRPGEFDPLADEPAAFDSAEPSPKSGAPEKKPKRPMLEFFSPSQLRAYEPPANSVLLGDYHIQRGGFTVLAGPPGCGKSRATLWLAALGARGEGEWFGLPIKSKFRTLILQNENGLGRLHRDFLGMGASADDLDEWVRVSSPPPSGLALANALFRKELGAMIRDFAPQLVIVDPWNACVRDSMEKDFQEGLTRLREVLAEAPEEPACLILHHLRKPKAEDKQRGRSLANLLSGSYVLVSVARSVLVMQPASDDTEDSRVVVTPAKNNDGQLGPRTAWERSEAWFDAVPAFDFEAFDSGGFKPKVAKVTEDHIRQLFAGGKQMAQKFAATELEALADVRRSAAYEALKLEAGRFSNLLVKDAATGFLRLRSGNSQPDSREGRLIE